MFGADLTADEIALERRLRYDPETNSILGLRREQAVSLPLEFTAVAEAEEVLTALTEDRRHLASEVCLVVLIVCNN